MMKMPKIYLSPAYHKWNACAIPGCDETTHNNEYLDELEVFLRANGIDYKRGPKRIPRSNEDGTQLMYKAVKESNEYKPDIHYISHTNASNKTAKGYRPIIFPGYTDARRLAELVTKYRAEIYPYKITVNTNTELYELNATNSTAYYEEHVFHDNAEDALWFHNNMENIARQTVKAFCEYFGLEYKEPAAENTPLYRVRKEANDSESQIGAFVKLENALSLAKVNGYNVYDRDGNTVYMFKEEDREEIIKEIPKDAENETEEDGGIYNDETANELPEEENTGKKTFSGLIEVLKKIIEIILKLFKK